MFKCMSKGINIIFVIFNVILFAINFALIDFFPKTLWFGWCPSQLGVFILSMIIAAIAWGAYFISFFKTQDHVDKKYKEMQEEVSK